MCTFQFFAISDIYFADFDRSLAVFYQKSSIIRNSCLCIIFVYSSVFFQSKCSITCYCISIRSYRFTKCILLIGLETCNFVCFPCRIPLINDVSIFVKYLDVSSSQFFMICDIYFTYFDRSDRVNKVISIYRCNISRNCIFAYCVNDFFSCCVFRKFCKLISPVAICCYFLTACFFSVCEKSYCNAFRTFCCLVIVIPGLDSLYADYLCFMSICKDKSFCCCSCYNCFITSRYFCFSYCVNNVLSIFLRVKFAPCVCPVVVRTQSYFFALCCLTSIKLYFNVLRSDSILVIIISPCLGYGNAGLSWFVAVGDRCSVDCCCIICNGIFCYGINDFFTICKFRKICEAVCPVICCGYIFCCYFCSVSKKSYFDALRTFSILIICIIPNFLTFYRSYFCFVSICDYKSCLCVSADFRCVTSYLTSFFYSVDNVLSVFLSIKTSPGICPVVCSIKSYFFTLCIFTCIKLYFNAIRSDSILVIIINPCFCYCDAGLSWCIAICDRCSVDCCCVIWNCIFCYGINDFFTICILRKICEVICPVVCCGYIFCCYFCSISKKSYFDAIRTFSILVVCIIPYLLATYRCCFWCVSIDDIVFINLSCVISYFNFTDCIVDCCSIFVNRKIIKCVLPVCCCSYCLACIYSSVCKKIYGNAGRTFSILVVIIIPGLSSGDSCNFRYMFIGQCCYCSVCSITCQFISFWNIFFCPCVLNCFAAFLFIEACN